MAISPGDLKCGEIIGNGGFSTVHRAVFAHGQRPGSARADAAPHQHEPRVVAFKEFHPHLFQSERDIRAVQQEIDLLTGIAHPNVIEVLGVVTECSCGACRSGPGLVLEFAQLGSLRNVLAASDSATSPLLTKVARLAIARDISEAMRWLHHEIKPLPVIHRDLKSANCA